MRALMLEAPESMLDDRRRRGADRWDEVWEGVLHMVPPPFWQHQHIGSVLQFVLHPHAERAGFQLTYESGLFRPGSYNNDYRVPDLMAAPTSSITKRGVEGPAAFLTEILSPDDESYEKLPFYAEMGVGEVLILDPESRMFEFYVLRGGQMRLVQPDSTGRVYSEALGVSFQGVAGPKLRVAWDGGQADV